MMTEQSDVVTDISDENVLCVNQEGIHEITKTELEDIAVKVEGSDSVLNSLHHNNVNIHSVNVTTASTQGIITIPVCVGSLSPCYISGGDHDHNTVVAPISVSCINSADNNNVNQNQSHSHAILSWEDAVAAEILPVRCKDTNAELHKNKFGSGNKGKCIKVGNEWYTPTEFESICGRGNSKDWKRSIRFGGRTLQTLIDKKFLIPHASSCICSNCVDDATATGPIRPFTPYQRKRKGRNNDNNNPKTTKLERLASKDSTTDESNSDVGTPMGLASAINPLTQTLIKINQSTALPSCNSEAWKKMEDAVEQLVSASVLLKSYLQEMKERTNNELATLRSQLNESSQNLQQALNQQQQQAQQSITLSTRNLEPQILRIFDSNRLQAYSIEVLDPETFKQLQVQPVTTTTNNQKVSNAPESNNVLPPISQLF